MNMFFAELTSESAEGQGNNMAHEVLRHVDDLRRSFSKDFGYSNCYCVLKQEGRREGAKRSNRATLLQKRLIGPFDASDRARQKQLCITRQLCTLASPGMHAKCVAIGNFMQWVCLFEQLFVCVDAEHQGRTLLHMSE